MTVGSEESNSAGTDWRVVGAVSAGVLLLLAQLHHSVTEHLPTWLRGIAMWLSDGVLLSCLAAVLLVVLVRHLLRDEPASIGWLLVLAIVVGAILRLALAPYTTLGAWPYNRNHAPFRLIWNSTSLQAAVTATGSVVSRTDVALNLTMCFAIVTPLAIFAHARYLLGDARIALVAAWVMTLLPSHIRFSHSEVAFIPSIACSSLMFALAHATMKEDSRRWRAVAAVGLGLVSLAAFGARPLNVLFYPVLLGTCLLPTRADVGWRRRGLVAVIAGLACAYTFAAYVLSEHGRDVQSGLSLETLRFFRYAFLSPRLNTLVNPDITPFGLLLVAFVGLFALVRQRRAKLALFLVGWLMLFFVTHGYSVPNEVAMQARYHLHLIVPFVFMVSVGVMALAKLWRPAAIAVGALVVAGPALTADFIADVEFSDQQEWDFVLEQAEALPDDCSVLELMHPPHSRFRFAGTLRRPEGYWERLHAIPINEQGSPQLRSVESLLSERPPTECVMYFEGLNCWGFKEYGERMTPACEQMHRDWPLELVAHTEFFHREYNDHNPPGIVPGEPVMLSLFRVTGPPLNPSP